ncbi:hypothetical protein THOG05_180054 [Vibrio rotiferianus]|nr:hypothetical protein THOG05_180054 [Vibrio rotiferianus]CAH1555048.1 hypothetical protein THOE12_150054 [Vibrio rotiferianus]CAH1572651.1 hypothetical protein THOG10_200048 [Vibrio rotiferianus]CAH1574647.1 hypothetical protein THOB06_200054 [Vibrio rotiferianus]
MSCACRCERGFRSCVSATDNNDVKVFVIKHELTSGIQRIKWTDKKERYFTFFICERESFSRFSHFSLQDYIYKIYIYDLLLDLLLGSQVSVDN